MDKFEYKVRSEEIKNLIAEGDYVQAAEIADTIDWRRVKSVMMLCTISDLYKINRRYEDAKNVLMLAYERRPGGRTICYSLCELCIKTGDFVQALNYYKEFTQVAPRDTSRYILQYKLYEAQEVSLEERIAVLEELKKRDYREKWAYELAFLYHRVGLATRCVEECDELALWFGDGKYVVKALELKMLHQPLTPEQEAVYGHRFDDDSQVEEEAQTGNSEAGTAGDMPENYGQELGYIQNYGQEPDYTRSYEKEPDYTQNYEQDNTYNNEGQAPYEEPVAEEQPPVEERINAQEQEYAAAKEREPEGFDDIDIQVKTVDVGKFNTINLQAELAAGLQEVLGGDQITHSILTPMLEGEEERESPEQSTEAENVEEETAPEEIEGTEVFFGETGEMAKVQPESTSPQEMSVIRDSEETEVIPEEREAVASAENSASGEAVVPARANASGEPVIQKLDVPVDEAGRIAVREMGVENKGAEEVLILDVQPPKELADVLSQEANGQISLVLPESTLVEKQLTGQMKIEDVLAEWERMKQESREKCQEEVRQRVLRQTGPMFSEFEASVRDGLLEKLEKGTISEEALLARMSKGSANAEETVQEPEYREGTETPEEPGTISDIGGNGEEAVEDVENGEPAETLEEGYPEEHTEETVEASEKTSEEEYAAEIAEAEEGKHPEESAKDSKEEYLETLEEIQEDGRYGESNYGDIAEKKTHSFVERDKAKIRGLTREEKELYAPFIQSRHSREQIVKAIDNISMAAYTGNVVITGEEGMDTMTLAKNMIREVRMMDSNFSGKVAKISGDGLNQRNLEDTLEHLSNGALIIQAASGMSAETATALHKNLQRERAGIVIFLEDTKKGIKNLFAKTPELAGGFTARMDLEALSNDMLVSFGRRYAREMEYSIDDMGVLALHTRIEELQTIDHAVTVIEVKQIVDEAIHHASRKTLGHFFDILLAKRYDDEDMIVLTEKDFVA